MTNNTKLILLLLTFISFQGFAQTQVCDANNPFEEKDGLLTIEMESGVRNNPNWKIGSEPDPNLPGATIDYLFWDGAQSFSRLSNAPITYNIKINTPGTYRFAWRMRVGFGDSRGEHNDAWLKIDADDFFGIKNGAKVYPKPFCTQNNLTCAEGNSTEGFMKAFGNRLDWGFVTNTNDGDSHRVFVTFNEPGMHTVTVDARSSFCFIDKMVFQLSGVTTATAHNLNNSESACANSTLSVNDARINKVNAYPNPTTGKVEITNLSGNGTFVLTNVQGAILKSIDYYSSTKTIDISDLKNGIYFISNLDKSNFFVQKIIKN